MNANQILQRGGGILRDGARLTDRLTRRLASGAYGVLQEARHLGRTPKPEMDDVTLARKVETEIFRASRIPKSSVNVNVVDGVVWLRGEVKRPQQVRSLEEKVRLIPEVRGVENLLHLVKAPAPTRADTPKRQQRTRSSTRRPTPRRTQGRVSNDRTGALARDAESSPAERASRGTGRTPAPLGSRGGDQTGSSDGESGSRNLERGAGSTEPAAGAPHRLTIEEAPGTGSRVEEAPGPGLDPRP